MGAISLSSLGAPPIDTAATYAFESGFGLRHILRSFSVATIAQKPTQSYALPSIVTATSRTSLASPSNSQQNNQPSTTPNLTPNTRTSSSALISQSPYTSLPHRPSSNGFTATALASILAAIAFLLISVFVLGFMLRRHKRKAHWKRIEESTTCKSKIQDDGSRRIMVTREIESRHEVVGEEHVDAGGKRVEFEIRGGRGVMK